MNLENEVRGVLWRRRFPSKTGLEKDYPNYSGLGFVPITRKIHPARPAAGQGARNGQKLNGKIAGKEVFCDGIKKPPELPAQTAIMIPKVVQRLSQFFNTYGLCTTFSFDTVKTELKK